MPKKLKRPKAQIAPGLTEERPAVPVHLPLVMEEREELIALLNKPVFIKAWNNAQLMRPPIFPASSEHFEGQHGDNRAAKALARLQGWEMHKAALIKQTMEVVRKSSAPPEEFPASGSLESEVKRNLKSAKT